ncbi:hypothetical protein GCM10010344_11650 [Streptomyces bluensis]|nr:hypothetical protein GCM10010344_11650 [Streptomyces bluensis]
MSSEGHSLLKPSLYFMAVVATTSAAMAPQSSTYPMGRSVRIDAYDRTYRARTPAEHLALSRFTPAGAPRERDVNVTQSLNSRQPDRDWLRTRSLKGLPAPYEFHYCFTGHPPGSRGHSRSACR